MLETLSVENVGIIDRADVEFSPGMVVITGETGAGKTLLVTALALLLGEKPHREIVGQSGESARVQAVFSSGENEVIVAREILASGRTRCRVDGVIVPVDKLSQEVKGQLQLYGQHLALAMATRANQGAALDRFGGISPERYLEAKRSLRGAEEALRSLRNTRSEVDSRQELLRYELNELEAAHLGDPGEDEVLLSELRLLERSRERAGRLDALCDAITGDAGVLDMLHAVSQVDPGSDIETRLRAVVADLEELARDAGAERDVIEDNPARRAEIETRLGELAHIKRRFGPTLSDALEALEQRAGELDGVTQVESQEGELIVRCQALHQEVNEEHDALVLLRTRSAASLEEQVTRVLSSLALERAHFSVGFDDTEPCFLFSPHESMKPLELAGVASGGELARVMLAVAAVVGADAPAVVFDEVDAGIGGSAALSVARKLQSIASERQVLVVTHLPQIASAAAQHLVVQKNSGTGAVSTTIKEVTGEERVAEIARMLSGHPNSSSALAHARELLASFEGAESVD